MLSRAGHDKEVDHELRNVTLVETPCNDILDSLLYSILRLKCERRLYLTYLNRDMCVCRLVEVDSKCTVTGRGN